MSKAAAALRKARIYGKNGVFQGFAYESFFKENIFETVYKIGDQGYNRSITKDNLNTYPPLRGRRKAEGLAGILLSASGRRISRARRMPRAGSFFVFC